MLIALPAITPASVAGAPSPPPKSIANTASMGFGRFAPAAGGSVKVDINGVRSRIGGVILLTSSASSARYTVSGAGSDNRTYILSMPPDGSVMLRSGVHEMAVTGFVSSAPAGGWIPMGPQTISVGATLQVAPGQAPGNYSGAFQVTLEYQ